MNCKPGDIAVVASVPPDFPSALGGMVRVIDVHEGHTRRLKYVYWRYESLSSNIPNWMPTVCDVYLKPIRDPGEDARDETLTWLDVPTKEIA